MPSAEDTDIAHVAQLRLSSSSAIASHTVLQVPDFCHGSIRSQALHHQCRDLSHVMAGPIVSSSAFYIACCKSVALVETGLYSESNEKRKGTELDIDRHVIRCCKLPAVLAPDAHMLDSN